jgi:sarcosine oxidase subunit beta
VRSRFSFIVVGGGLHGAATTWELARSGEDVILIDAVGLAAGASGGPGTRGVRANHRDHRELPLMRAAATIWPMLDRELGRIGLYRRTGSVYLYEREVTGHRGVVALQARHHVLAANGFACEILDRDAVRQLLPGVSAEICAGLWCPGDGTVAHAATTKAYVAAARRRGADVRVGQRVQSIRPLRDGASAVRLESGEQLVADRGIALAVNAGTAQLLRASDAEVLPTWNVHPQALIVRSSQSLLPIATLVGHDHRSLSVKRIDDDHVMVSGGWRGAVDGGVQADQVEGNLREASAVFPALTGAPVVAAHTDRAESVTLDQLPVIDRSTALPGVFLATGWSGHGASLAPAVGRLLADWMRGATRPPQFEPFRLDRWSAAVGATASGRA